MLPVGHGFVKDVQGLGTCGVLADDQWQYYLQRNHRDGQQGEMFLRHPLFYQFQACHGICCRKANLQQTDRSGLASDTGNAYVKTQASPTKPPVSSLRPPITSAKLSSYRRRILYFGLLILCSEKQQKMQYW